jgi:hypothetical protein
VKRKILSRRLPRQKRAQETVDAVLDLSLASATDEAVRAILAYLHAAP